MTNEEWYKSSSELGKNFFDRWSILSGGTFTLLIPFVQSLDGGINCQILLVLIEILLLTSLLTASLHPWIASEISFYNSLNFRDENSGKKHELYVSIQRINYMVAIISYPIALILLIIFINLNIF